jgi:uncharacterized membrane protein
MKTNLAIWVIIFVLSFLFGHFHQLSQVPIEVLDKHMSKITLSAGGYNIFLHRKRPSAENRVVPRPSPELAYSVCVFKLENNAIRIRFSPPEDTYWSVSIFDEETNNIKVYNDRTQFSGEVVIYQRGKESFIDIDNEVSVLPVSSERGVILVRIFAPDQNTFDFIENNVRPYMSCSEVTLESDAVP